MRKDKRQTYLIPPSTYPRLARSRKRKKRRQHKQKKERLRNLRRKGRNLRKRRRQARQNEKTKDASIRSASILPDTQAVPSHNAHLVELLTGGNKQFLVLPRLEASGNFTNTKQTPQSLRRRLDTKQLIFLPFQVVSGGGLKWLPYNPNIRVSIQVDERQHRDRTDRTDRAHLPHSSIQERGK